jgi:hypothetical protein
MSYSCRVQAGHFIFVNMSDTADLAMLCHIRASVLRAQANAAGTDEERAACQRMAEQWAQMAENGTPEPALI